MDDHHPGLGFVLRLDFCAMSEEAKDLRELAARIEQVTRDSRACSMAWDQVQALVDYLCLRARVMETTAERDRSPGRGCPHCGYHHPPDGMCV
jgi:hypothetical protein